MVEKKDFLELESGIIEAFKYLNAAISFFDENFVVKYVNEAGALSYSNMGFKEVVGSKIHDIHSKKTIELLEKLYDSFEKKELNSKKTTMLLEDRSKNIVHLPVYDEDEIFRGCMEIKFYS